MPSLLKKQYVAQAEKALGNAVGYIQPVSPLILLNPTYPIFSCT